jgi:hypothetical protein
MLCREDDMLTPTRIVCDPFSTVLKVWVGRTLMQSTGESCSRCFLAVWGHAPR